MVLRCSTDNCRNAVAVTKVSRARLVLLQTTIGYCLGIFKSGTVVWLAVLASLQFMVHAYMGIRILRIIPVIAFILVIDRLRPYGKPVDTVELKIERALKVDGIRSPKWPRTVLRTSEHRDGRHTLFLLAAATSRTPSASLFMVILRRRSRCVTQR